MVLHCKNFNLLHSRMFWAKFGWKAKWFWRRRWKWEQFTTTTTSTTTMTDDRQAHWSFRIRWAKTFGWDTESSGGAPCKDHAFIYLFLKILGMEQDLLFEISYHRCLKTGATPLLAALCSFRIFIIIFQNLIHILSCKDWASPNKKIL